MPSLPGVDRSTPGAATSLLDVADVMAEFIRAVAGGWASVIGESFGGGGAAWLAIRHPAVASRLVLAAPAGLSQAGGSLVGRLPAEMAVSLYGQAPTVQPPPEEAAQRSANRQHAVRIVRARPAFDPELHQQLAHVQAPTLVLWGTADRMIRPSQARSFVGAIPNARLVTIEGAPHVLSAAVPEEFLTAVLAFLGGSGRARTEATSRTVI